MKKKILIISAHPDDETLGCGATVSKLNKEGHISKAIFLTDGVSSRDNKNTKIEAINRKKCANDACRILGIKKKKFYNFPDNSLDTVPKLTLNKVIEKEILKFKPNLIFTHDSNDLNIDHRIVCEATIVATRFYKTKHEIMSYEVLSSTDLGFHSNEYNFKPNVFFDAKKTIKNKISALKKYKNELRKFPHPRSLEGTLILSRYRGMFASLEYAEGFKLIKKVD
ncbi:MAG: GlcNAc-PI de-N-acetylase [Candidatus Marinimicrobia bacterium]|nr:GlcNAc-PI de-N-acetylase [Candidatus Neomarinimicrobiota bacterium]|tara:strand:+ start:2976 stop:3647 length:672 start_codon:yes stop_codon:yes gene_type:complete